MIKTFLDKEQLDVKINLIKLYYNDVGILTNVLYKNSIDAVLNQDKGVNLGSAYETAAAMELIAHGHELYYFDSKKVGEVDFLLCPAACTSEASY